MAQLAAVLYVTFLIGFGLLNTVKTEEHIEVDRKASEESENNDRAASAYAHAAVSMRPLLGGFQPRPPPYLSGSPIPQNSLLQCFSCTNCPEINENSPRKYCPRAAGLGTSTCVKYVEEYKHMKNKWVIRGCATDRGSCADIKQAHAGQLDNLKLHSCNECEGDLCNSASHSATNLAMAIISLLVVPLLAKATFS